MNTFGYVGGKPLRLVAPDGTSEKDVGSIEAIFRMTIDRLVACKCRLEGNGWSNAYMNNLIAMYIDDNLMERYPQAAMVQKDMMLTNQNLMINGFLR